MNAIVLKELRENAKWALLLMLGIGALMAWAISDSSAGIAPGEIMTFVGIVGFGGAGLILGLLQIFQDQWRGRYAFVMNRPISRTKIYRAKVIAGMLLYFPAGAIPLLLATIWCVVPGNFNAPQRWYMSIPAWCDLVNGTTFYLAGILIAAREARWFGSRILPLGIGVILALAAMLLPLNVFEALLITAIGWVILIPATHGAFVHRESTNRQSSMSLAAQALTVICGVGILTGISWAFIESVARSAGRTRQAYTTSAFSQQGEFFWKRVDEFGKHVSTRDAAGNDVAFDRFGPELQLRDMSAPWDELETISSLQRRTRYGFHHSQSYLQLLSGNQRSWYLPMERKIEIYGMSGQDHGWIGSIGENGFVPAPNSAEPFAEPLTLDSGWTTPIIAHTRRHVYTFIPKQLKSIVAFDAPADERIHSVTALQGLRDDHGYQPYHDEEPAPPQGQPLVLAIRTDRGIHVVENQRVVFSTKLHYPEDPAMRIQFGINNDRQYVFVYQFGWRGNSPPASHTVIADASGAIVKQFDWTAHGRPEDLYVMPLITRLQFIPIPPGFVVPFMSRILFYSPEDGRWANYLQTVMPSVVLGLICAVINVFLARWMKYSRAGTIAWGIGGVLLGIVGVLGLIANSRRALSISCASCGKQRSLTQFACEHCGESFAPPRMTGIEIFET